MKDLLLKKEDARLNLCSLVASFYFVNCLQNAKSVDPTKAWKDFLEGKKSFSVVKFKLGSNKYFFDSVVIKKLIDTYKWSEAPDNFFYNLSRVGELIDICEKSGKSKSPFITFGNEILWYLYHFRISLEIYTKDIREHRKKVARVNEIKKKIGAESIDFGVEFEETMLGPSLRRPNLSRVQSETLKMAEYLSKVEKDWEQKFKDDVTSDCVKTIAKYYRDLNSLEAAFAGYDGLLKFFKGTFDVVDLNNKESLRLEIEKTKGYLSLLVTHFYVLICSKDQGVSSFKLWSDIFGIRTISNVSKSYEYTDVE